MIMMVIIMMMMIIIMMMIPVSPRRQPLPTPLLPVPPHLIAS
jgi:hypothetical protein